MLPFPCCCMEEPPDGTSELLGPRVTDEHVTGYVNNPTEQRTVVDQVPLFGGRADEAPAAAPRSTPQEAPQRKQPAPTLVEDSFLVRLIKTPAMKIMGMDLRYKAKGAIKVREVFEDGLVGSWNRKNQDSDQDCQVRAGDLILSVNGQEGKPEDLVKLLAESNEVELRIKRGSSSSSPEQRYR